MAWVIKLSLLLAVLVRTIFTDHYIRKEAGEFDFYMSSTYPEYILAYQQPRVQPVICYLGRRFINLKFCSRYNGRKVLYVDPGQTVELQCEGTRDDDNMTVQWYDGENQLFKSSVHLNVTDKDCIIKDFKCAIIKNEHCVYRQDFYLYIKMQYVVVSVGEEAVLSCLNQDDSNGTETWWDYRSYISNRYSEYAIMTVGKRTGNFFLHFKSLVLKDIGVYRCRSNNNKALTLKVYYLLVFLKSESDLLTEFVSEGEQVVLRCNSNLTEYNRVVWFRRTAEGEHVFLDTDYDLPYMAQDLDGRMNSSHPGSFLVLSNLTLKDTGEYWCGLFYNGKCVSVTKTLLLEWDPFGINSTFYRVYSTLMGCTLLGMVCALISVNLKTRRRDQVLLKTRRDQASLKTRRTAAQRQRQRSSRVEEQSEERM